jgi:hypothetical protein
LSKVNLEIADNLDFEDGDIAITIKQDGAIGKIIMPTMNEEMRNSEGYKKMLDVVELLSPGAKEEFIKHNSKEKGSIH